MYLSLPVVNKAGTPLASLGECIRAFTEPEKLCGGNQWYCPQCKTHVDAEHIMRLWKLPPILLVHLKRFRFGCGRAGAPNAAAVPSNSVGSCTGVTWNASSPYYQQHRAIAPGAVAQPAFSQQMMN